MRIQLDVVSSEYCYRQIGVGDCFMLPKGETIYMKTRYRPYSSYRLELSVNLENGKVYSFPPYRRVVPLPDAVVVANL